MSDHQVHNHQYLRESMTSSESSTDNEDSNDNEKAMVVEGEINSSTHIQRSKQKGCSRHTPHQIQQMESFFQECPHPNEMQRRDLARQLDLNPMQIKYWFQNKCTQVKSRNQREEIHRLMIENQRLIAENQRLKYRGLSSNDNGEKSFEENHLRIENGRPKDKIARMSCKGQALEIGGSSGGNDVVRSLPPPTLEDKHKIVELAIAAMDELINLVSSGPPIWIPGFLSEVLNIDEYTKSFPLVMGPKPPGIFRSETSRECVVVHMNHTSIIEILMNVDQWVDIFCDIVARGMTLEVLSSGMVGNYNGALQVMSAEFQIPSPLVPTRDNYFSRYCKHLQNETWAVVDVSLDHLRSGSTISSRRRPSGCVIQGLPHGYSKVTWVEHVDVDDRGMMHNQFRPLVNSCIAFGAKRWLASLNRHCERLASAMLVNIPSGEHSVKMSMRGRESILRMAAKMMRSFSSRVSASKAHVWTSVDRLEHGGDLKVMTTKSDELGRSDGIVLNVATSAWLPLSPKRVFDFLRDNSTRSQWDVLSNGGVVEEITHIATGRDPRNRVSLLRVMNRSANAAPINLMILQESCTDGIGSYVVYAPIDVVVTNLVLNGNDKNDITLFPLGFAIFPDGDDQCASSIPNPTRSRGSMVTISSQLLVDTASTQLSLSSVGVIISLIKPSIERIKVALVEAPTN